MSFRQENVRVVIQSVSDLPTVAEQYEQLISLTQRQAQESAKAAASMKSEFSKLTDAQKAELAQQTATQKAELQQQGAAQRAELQQQNTAFRAEKAQETAAFKAEEERKTAIQKNELSERKALLDQQTSATKAEAQQQTTIVRGEQERQTAAQKAELSERKALLDQQTAVVKSEVAQQTAVIKAEQDRQTAILREEERRRTMLLKSELAEARTEYGSLTDTVKDYAAVIAAAFTFGEIKQFGMDVIDAKSKIDQLKIALDVMLGSKRESNAIYQEIVRVAKETPFTLEELTENAVKLKGFGVETKNLIPDMLALGNMAAAVGKDKLPQMTLALGQVAATGRLMGDELNQFVEAGVPMYDLLAASMGKTRKEVDDLAKAHQISFKDIEKAILESSEKGGKYYQMMALQSKTLGGEVSNLSDRFFLAKAKIGDFFEGELKGGIKMLGDFMDATIGSDNAIKRTLSTIASAVAAYGTWRIATNAQAIASTANKVVTEALSLTTGTLNLVMITATRSTEGFTRAQQESAVAARSTWATLAANPIGALVTVVGLAVSAYFAFQAANQKVTETMGEQEYALKREQEEMNRLAEAATNASDTTGRRKQLIEQLLARYPDYFAGLNSEKTSNAELKGILDKVNVAYDQRIALAKQAYTVEKLNENRRSLWDQEAAAIARLTERVPDLKKYGNDSAAILDHLNKNIEDFRKVNGSDGWVSLLDNVVAGKPMDTFLKVKKGLEDNKKQLEEAEKDVQKFKGEAQKADIAAVEKYFDELRKQHAGNKKMLADLDKQEQARIDEINGKVRQEEIATIEKHGKEKVKKVSQTLIAIQELENKQGELTLKEQERLLDLREKLEIENVNKSKRRLSDKEEAILKIQQDYAEKRHVFDLAQQAKEEKAFIDKVIKFNAEITEINAQRDDADAIAARLGEITTQEERLEVIKEYGKKTTDELRDQQIERLQIRRDQAIAEVDLIKAEKGAKSKEYYAAYLDYLKLEKEFSQALLSQSKNTTDTRLKEATSAAEQHKKVEEMIQDNYLKTEKVSLETAMRERENRMQTIKLVIGQLSQMEGLIGQMANVTLQATSNLDVLSGKTKAKAEEDLKSAQNLLGYYQEMMKVGGEEGDKWAERYKNQVEVVNQATQKFAALSEMTTKAQVDFIMAAVDMIASAIDFVVGGLAEASRTAAESIQRQREIITGYHDAMIEMNQRALDVQLEAFADSYDQRKKVLDEFYAKQKGIVESRDLVDAQLAHSQEVLQIQADTTTKMGEIWDIKKGAFGPLFMVALAKTLIAWKANKDEMEAAEWHHQANLERAKINQLQLDIERFAAERDAKIQALEEELAAYTQAKEQEIDAAEEAADAKIDLIERARDAKKEALQLQLDAVKEAYSAETEKVKESYETQLSALRERQAAEQAALKETYALKQQLLEQSKADEVTTVGILDRVRQEALERYRVDEIARLQATRDRILSTLTDEGERMQVTNEYANRIADVHKQVEEAKLDKTKGVSLATTQLRTEEKTEAERLKKEEAATVKALQDQQQQEFKRLSQERDDLLKKMKDDNLQREKDLKEQITKLEADAKSQISQIQTDLTAEINKLKDQIAAKDKETAEAMKAENQSYAKQVIMAEYEIMEAKKAVAIAELRAEQALLRSKRWFMNKGKINDAIADIENAINEINGAGGRSEVIDKMQRQEELAEEVKNLKARIPELENQLKAVQSAIEVKKAEITAAEAAGQDSWGAKIELSSLSTQEYSYKANIDEIARLIKAKEDEIERLKFFKGTEFVDSNKHPDGIDTIPAMLTKGERVLTVDQNQALAGISNEALVQKVQAFDQLLMGIPRFEVPIMGLPDWATGASGGSTIDLSAMLAKMDELNQTFANKKHTSINVDRNGFRISEMKGQSIEHYYTNLFHQ
ncbi:tape measure protein [Tellurirhabdus bombi]|uniref:tape measure protein n=1 Tax=Tellurirhabdus bombi TaxID=2907205 RepID=UPI001F36D549|nr:tape measure protein [Tellurirhabdus bombi]